MINHNYWRDQQLNSFANLTGVDAVLVQEKIMLDFVTQHNISWKWHGNHTKFQQFCQQYIDIKETDCQGVIVFGTILHQLSTSLLVNKIRKLTQDFDYAYVGINRYEVILHDLDFELPDSIEDSLDLVMNYCDPKFCRLHKFDQVDGNHMVAAHPMDCYRLCKL